MNAKEQKLASVEAEIARERAESLSRSAQRLRGAIEALRRYDAVRGGPKSRTQLLSEASEACVAFLVQREVMGFGMQDAEAVRRDYEVPEEVWHGMGAVRHAS